MPAVQLPDGPGRSHLPAVELDPERASDALRRGELDLLGRMAWSSNATFLVNASLDGSEVAAVYKPRRGEQPLWDFPDGTLCRREVAAYEVSNALGWPSIPPTLLREGPEGEGAVQLFIEADPDEHFPLRAVEVHERQRLPHLDVEARVEARAVGAGRRERGQAPRATSRSRGDRASPGSSRVTWWWCGRIARLFEPRGP